MQQRFDQVIDAGQIFKAGVFGKWNQGAETEFLQIGGFGFFEFFPPPHQLIPLFAHFHCQPKFLDYNGPDS